MTSRICLFVAGLTLSAGLATAGDWPQWRGPDRSGIASDTGVMTTFPEGGPKLVWTFDKAGLGYSASAIVGDRLYGMGQDGKEEFLFALDVRNGKQLWRVAVGLNFDNSFGGGPRGTPSVDGDAIYLLTANSDLVCVPTSGGKPKWSVNLKKEYKGQLQKGWGYSESPLVDGELVICTPGGEDGTYAAFDKKTGKLRWQSSGLSASATYSSLMPMTVGGVKTYVGLNTDGAAGIAATDGKVLWKERVVVNDIAMIPTPVIQGNLIYLTGDYGTSGCALVEVTADKSGGVTAKVVYKNKNLENHHGGVVLIDGIVCGSTGNANNRKTLPLVGQDLKTGEVKWKKDGLESSSICAADGHVYLYGQSTGTLVCGKVTAAGFAETGRFAIPKLSTKHSDNRVWAHPVIANGKLYLRDQELLYCFDLKPGPVAE